MIGVLGTQGTAHLPITTEAQLVASLRRCLEDLNDITFSDLELTTFLKGYLANGSDGVAEKTEKFQRNWRFPLRRDDGTTKNVEIVDKDNVNRNRVQVINQYAPGGGTYPNRYDVTILFNGLPLVHTELKRRGGSIREAFNQIERYGRESFWADSGLFEWVQLFVISNDTLTKYYSNTTRVTHVAKQAETKEATRRRQSGSFKFTSYWADARNHLICNLEDFARTFLTKRTLLAIHFAATTSSASRGRPSSPPTRAAASTRTSRPRSRPSGTVCPATPSWMPSATRTCCPSAWAT